MRTNILSKPLVLLFFSIIHHAVMAERIMADGIYYDVHDDKLEVVEHPDRYRGVVIIPETVIYDGIQYTVTQIGRSAFQNCIDLLTVGISSTVNDINGDTFDGCESLEEIHVDSDNSTYASYDRALYNKNMTTLIRCPQRTSGAYIVREGVTTIMYSAFSDCTIMNSVTLPETVCKIGSCAFKGCAELTTINLPDNITSIGQEAFAGCI